MKCKHLDFYSPGIKEWSVACCSAKKSLYVPSAIELEKFCQSDRHGNCHAFLLTIGARCHNTGRPVLCQAC